MYQFQGILVGYSSPLMVMWMTDRPNFSKQKGLRQMLPLKASLCNNPTITRSGTRLVKSWSWSKSVNPLAMEKVRILEATRGYMAAVFPRVAVISRYKEGATVTWHKFKVSLTSLAARALGLAALASESEGPTMKRVESLKYILMDTSC